MVCGCARYGRAGAYGIDRANICADTNNARSPGRHPIGGSSANRGAGEFRATAGRDGRSCDTEGRRAKFWDDGAP